ncbi:MAG: suppressor of fused domain protein [Deltaproteobacteria bacterium]|nr:suppressor of fused domain protein [Deltaproteobacteria bacterium]
MDVRYLRQIEAHYESTWGSPQGLLRWTKGPIERLPDGFAVLVYQATDDMRAFATRGMSQPSDDDRLELHAFCRPADEARVQVEELLTVITDYHRTGSSLGLGHTVNFGRPWAPGSQCTHGLISLPYLDGPTLEWCRPLELRCLWLIPITRAELEYKKEHGLEALEQRFEEVQFNYLDVQRASVV